MDTWRHIPVPKELLPLPANAGAAAGHSEHVTPIRGRRPVEPADERTSRFRAVFDENYLPLLAYALRRTSDPTAAAEVMADTMLVAWRRIDDVPTGEQARPWLYGVARKVLGNRRRADERRRRLTERSALEVGGLVANNPTEMVPDQMWVRAALATLDEIDREVLTLTAWEGLSPSEIAVALGIPAGTARTRLHRARARVRTQLEATSLERSESPGHVLDDGHRPIRDSEEVR